MKCLKVQWTHGYVFLALQVFYISAIDNRNNTTPTNLFHHNELFHLINNQQS